MKPLAVLGMCLLLVPFAAAQVNPGTRQPESSCGPSGVKFHVHTNGGQPKVSALDPGTARVYVIEDWQLQGTGGLTSPVIRVGMDGKWIGADHGNSWLSFTIRAGAHHLCADWQPGAFHWEGLTALYGFDGKPDRTYYFRVRMPYVYEGYGILLEPLNVDEAHLLLSHYPQAVSKAGR